MTWGTRRENKRRFDGRVALQTWGGGSKEGEGFWLTRTRFVKRGGARDRRAYQENTSQIRREAKEQFGDELLLFRRQQRILQRDAEWCEGRGMGEREASTSLGRGL